MSETETVLVRIGPIKQEVVIDEPFFRCGRMRDCNLVCLSLLVSREHCIFTRMPDALYVTDLKSSNGVYVNGELLKANKAFRLNENDLIGIGCCEYNNLNETTFVYQVKKRVVIKNDCDSSTTAINEVSVTNDVNSERLIRKEMSKRRVLDNNDLPSKIQKTVDNKALVNSINVDNDDDDDDIQIIECTSTSSNGPKENTSITKENKEKIKGLTSLSSIEQQNIKGMSGVAECSSTSDTEDKKNFEKCNDLDISSTMQEKNRKIEKLNVKDDSSAILPDIIDITDTEPESCQQKDNDKIMEIDLEPNVQNLKNDQTTTKINSVKVNVKAEPVVMNNLNEHENVINIKPEPDWGAFSQVDLVEINDDEDIFACSQLFNNTNQIKQEPGDNEDNDIPQLSQFLDDEDENVITILDSDDENVCGLDETSAATNALIIKIKEEPKDMEFVDVGPEPVDVNNIDINKQMCLDDFNVPSTSEAAPRTNLDDIVASNKTPEPEGLQSEKEKTEPTSSKDISKITIQEKIQTELSVGKDTSKASNSSSTNKTKRKGVEIVEPHFIKSKKKTRKPNNKDTNKSKDKSESDKKHSENKKHSSSSSKSSREKSTREDSSRSKNLKKDKDKSLTGSKKSSSRDEKHKNKKDSHDKHKSSSSENSKKDKNSDISKEKNKNDTNHNNDTSNISIHNTTPSTPEAENSNKPKPRVHIVKPKITTMSRGDRLCESMLNLRPKPRKDLKKSSAGSPKVSKPAPKPDSISSFVIPRRQVPSSTIPSSIPMTSQLSALSIPNPIAMTSPLYTSSDASEESITPVTSSNKKNALSEITNSADHMDLLPTDDENDRSPSPPPAIDSMTNNNTSTAPQLKPALTIPSLLNTTQKRVSFKENIAAVKEFPIEEGNKMRNIKDGLGLRSTRKDLAIHRSLELKIEDFLARIFAWEPVWLEQQKKVKSLPPIVKTEDMQQLPTVFQSYEQYYKKMEVLLLLETWQQLVKEYDCTGNRYNTSVVLPCVIVRNSIRQMQTPNGLRYSMLTIHSLITKNQLKLQNHPVYGDMIILEYVIRQGGFQKLRRAFAYVVNVQQQNSLKYLRSDDILCKYVKDPTALMTYTVQAGIMDEQTVQFDQVSRLRSILYMRSHLRLIQGLQFVPHSALRDSILKVNIDEFQLEPIPSKQIVEYELITKEKLNERQKEAVIKFTNASVRLEPKIGLLIGPPGTGKSKVIANLVTEILYGEGRYVNGRPLRILVCAPSNAAIDEIVLRLLDIRSAIPDHRFKMVRIGRIESMHEEVKKISLSELAKREAQKIHSDKQHKNVESLEQKKYRLKAEIDALELLVNSKRNKQYEMDLRTLKTKYEKLTHRSPEEEFAELNKIQNSAKMVILQKANVIACTLSSCYTGQMETIFGGNSEKIATCIVDEATQCCEAETLIPLMLGVKSLILVGDPNQLPATVMSTDAKRLGLDRSLFTRTKQALEPQCSDARYDSKDPIITLNVQYRMVNAISHWPNKYFYGCKLIDSVNYKQAFPFQPYRILNLDGLQDDIKFSNTSEALFVGNLINCMMTCSKLSAWNKKISVGVITPYQNQKSIILNTIRDQTKNVSPNIKNKFYTEVNTIDSFQGQERDVIIMSCVRSSGIGFMSDQQRLCVALTRAKFTLIICGNFTTFQKDNTWSDLLKDARARGVVVRLNTTAKPSEIKPHIVRLD